MYSTILNSSNPQQPSEEVRVLAPFQNEETEQQRGKGAVPTSHSTHMVTPSVCYSHPPDNGGAGSRPYPGPVAQETWSVRRRGGGHCSSMSLTLKHGQTFKDHQI